MTAGIATARDGTLLLALGLGLWAVTAGQTHLVAASRMKIALGLQGLGALLAVAACSAVALGAAPAVALAGILVLSGVAMIWFTAFA